MEENTLTFPHLQAVLEEYGQAVRNQYQDNLITSDRIASGKLLNSVEYRLVVDGNHYIVELEMAKWWRYVEWDTKPHFPPLAPIREWIRVKPVIPRQVDGVTPTIDQLAYLIGRKISREGTTGTHDLQEAVKSTNDAWLEKIYSAIDQDIEEQVNVIITEFMLK